MVEFIDTHCHINIADYFPNPEEAVVEAREAGVTRLISVGVDLAGSHRAIELADRFEGVYAIVGHHPNSAADYRTSMLKEYEEMLRHPKAVALGEIGLDNHWDYATKEQQLACLHDQLDLGKQMAVPLVFHCREAYPELLSILETRQSGLSNQKSTIKNQKFPLLFHCFSGDEQDAQRAIALDCYFGVDGPITYKKADALREVVKGLPKNMVLLETDSPFMAPAPHRGKPNKPAYIPLIAQALADLWKSTLDECVRITTGNARKFFDL